MHKIYAVLSTSNSYSYFICQCDLQVTVDFEVLANSNILELPNIGNISFVRKERTQDNMVLVFEVTYRFYHWSL